MDMGIIAGYPRSLSPTDFQLESRNRWSYRQGRGYRSIHSVIVTGPAVCAVIVTGPAACDVGTEVPTIVVVATEHIAHVRNLRHGSAQCSIPFTTMFEDHGEQHS